MAKAAPSQPGDERLFIRLVRNHAEFRSTLVALRLTGDLASLDQHASSVVRGWFSLGRELLGDAQAALKAGRTRSVYSRAYYAAYNCSKAVRYRVQGTVSLKGDDHQKAGDLPDDFPEVANWAARMPELYEHRLRADYDNWSLTNSENTLSPEESVRLAGEFIRACEDFFQQKFGVAI